MEFKGIRDLAKLVGLKQSELKRILVNNRVLINGNLNPDLLAYGSVRNVVVTCNGKDQMQVVVNKKEFYVEYIKRLLEREKENPAPTLVEKYVEEELPF